MQGKRCRNQCTQEALEWNVHGYNIGTNFLTKDQSTLRKKKSSTIQNVCGRRCTMKLVMTKRQWYIDASVVGAQLLLNRARHAAFAFGKTVRQDAKYAARRAELRLKHLGKCNCAQVVHKDTCPQSYWHKCNALVMIREEERAVVQAMRVAEKAAGKFAEKERETSLKKNKRILSDVERCAAAVEERMKEFCWDSDVLIKIAQVWGSDVFSIEDPPKGGKPRFDNSCLPLEGKRPCAGRKWMTSRLAELEFTNEDFWHALKANRMCIDYALLSLETQRDLGLKSGAIREKAFSVAKSIIPQKRGWTGHRPRKPRLKPPKLAPKGSPKKVPSAPEFIELSEQNLMQFLFRVPAAINDTIVHLNQRGVGTGRSQHLQDEHVRLGCLEILLRFGLVPSAGKKSRESDLMIVDPNMVDVAIAGVDKVPIPVETTAIFWLICDNDPANLESEGSHWTVLVVHDP